MHEILVLYGKLCAMALALAFTLGLVCPYLISADDTLLVFLGFTLLLGVPPAVGIFSWHACQHLQQLLKDKENAQKAATSNRRAR